MTHSLSHLEQIIGYLKAYACPKSQQKLLAQEGPGL